MFLVLELKSLGFFKSSFNCSVVAKVFVIHSIKISFAPFESYDLNSENVFKLELPFHSCYHFYGYLI